MSDTVKLPVVDTLAQSLGFATKRFPTVIKAALLPSLIIYLPMLWIIATTVGGWIEIIPELVEMEGQSSVSDDQAVELFAALAPFYFAMLLLMPLSLLYNAMVAVPLSRAIVLDEKPGFLRLDGIVWRYFFGQILFCLLILGVMLAIFGAAAAAIASLEAAEVPEIAGIAVGLFALLAFVFATIRLSLFMVEIAVSGKFGVRASFRVTRGNVWRLIGFGLLSMIAIIVLSIGLEIVLTAFGALALASNFEAMEAAASTEDIEAIFAALRTMIVSPAGGVFATVYVIYTLFLTGFQMALPAFVYKNLGGGGGQG